MPTRFSPRRHGRPRLCSRAPLGVQPWLRFRRGTASILCSRRGTASILCSRRGTASAVPFDIVMNDRALAPEGNRCRYSRLRLDSSSFSPSRASSPALPRLSALSSRAARPTLSPAAADEGEREGVSRDLGFVFPRMSSAAPFRTARHERRTPSRCLGSATGPHCGTAEGSPGWRVRRGGLGTLGSHWRKTCARLAARPRRGQAA
jgi:hypothetical protein